MNAHVATKVGVIVFDLLTIAANVLTIGKERKVSTPAMALGVITILAIEAFAVWRWL